MISSALEGHCGWAAGPGKDEDPSLLRARDGRMVVTWFSERTGSAGIDLASTDRGASWSAAARISSSTSPALTAHSRNAYACRRYPDTSPPFTRPGAPP